MKLNVLIVSSQRSLNQRIKEILLKESVSIITFCDRLDQIEEECKQMTYDMMIVNEDSIHDIHNLMIYHKKFSCIIVCLKHQVKESYLHQCKAHHMVILMKPIKKHVFTQILTGLYTITASDERKQSKTAGIKPALSGIKDHSSCKISVDGKGTFKRITSPSYD